MKRKDFNNTFCKVFVLSSLSLPALAVSCDKSEDVIETPPNIDPELSEYGVKKSGNNLLIYMDHPSFQDLKSPGGYVNNLDHGVLILRKNQETVIALNNCCPHQGTRNRWRLVGDKFLCNNHGNSFGISEGNIAECNSNRTSGNLKQYPASFEDSIITVDLS